MSTSKTCDVLGQTNPALSLEAILNCDDILIEILLHVSAKSLIRLKCVCKRWLNLISSPSFGHDHTCRSSYLISGFYLYTGPYESIYTVSLKPQQSVPTLSFLYGALNTYDIDILDSCNGLILCSHGNRLLYSVSNPTTQKYKEIILPPPANNGSIRLCCLAFDPTRSMHYRVLIIRQDDTGLYEIDMYLSEDKSVKRVYAMGEPCGLVDHMVFWDGAVHWLDEKGSTHLQFDVRTEKLVETLLPSKAFDHFRFLYLGECDGNLLLIEGCLDYKRGYRIHEMRKGTRHWNLKQWVHIKNIEHLPLQETDFMHVLSVLKRSHLSDVELVLADSKKVYSYNTKLNKMEVLIDFSSSNYSRGTCLCPFSFARYFIERLSPL